jgi:hypothetical protein
MKTYKRIAAVVLVSATLFFSLLAILVVLDMSTLESAVENAQKIGLVLLVLALSSVVTTVIVRSLSRD